MSTESAGLFSRLCHWFQRAHPWPSVAAVLLALVVAALVPCMSVDPNMELMLPAGSSPQRALQFLRESGFANKLVVAVENRDPAQGQAAFVAQLDRLAAGLKQSPLISRVVAPSSLEGMMTDFAAFKRAVPLLLDEAELARVGVVIAAPDGIDTIPRQKQRQMLRPDGLMAGQTGLRDDLFGWQLLLLRRFERLGTAMGYDVVPEAGHFFSRDGRRALVIAESPVPITDATAAKALVAFVQEQMRKLPPTLHASLVCGYSHTVDNERVVKRDVWVLTLIGSILFPLLLVLVFRDARSLLIFVVPLVACVASLGVAALLFPRVSLLVIGLATSFAGMAVDYAIHVYVAVRHGRDRVAAVSAVALPTALGALTTCAVFVAFFSSTIAGYWQMAVFALMTLLLSLVYALFLLPWFVRAATPLQLHGVFARVPLPVSRHGRLALLASAVVLGCVALFYAGRVHFAATVVQLDGVSAEVRTAEAAFERDWTGGNGGCAMLVLSGRTAEEAQEAAQAAVPRIRRRVAAPETVASITDIWPALSAQRANLAAWKRFWAEHEAPLRERLQTAGVKYGFTPNAFDPFFDRLRDLPEPTPEPASHDLYPLLAERFMAHGKSGSHVFLFFPDTPELAARVAADFAEHGSLLVSRHTMGTELTQLMTAEVSRISWLAGGLIVLMTFLLIRDIRTTLLALIPAVAGVTGSLAVLGACGFPLTVASLIGSILLLGLCIDYGIYMSFIQRHGLAPHLEQAVTLCAVTTLMGISALLFAQHPALFSLGVTLVPGILIGYLTAVVFVPVLGDLLHWRKVVPCLAAVAALGLAGGCQSVRPPATAAEEAAWRQMATDFAGRTPVLFAQTSESLSSVVFDFRGHPFTSLGTLRLEPAAGRFQVTGFSPTGIKLFELQHEAGTTQSLFVLPAITELARGGDFGKAVGADIARLYLQPAAAVLARAPVVAEGEGSVLFSLAGEEPGSVCQFVFDRASGLLVEKRGLLNGRKQWSIRYEDYRSESGLFVPHRMSLDFPQRHYRLAVRVKQWSKTEGL